MLTSLISVLVLGILFTYVTYIRAQKKLIEENESGLVMQHEDIDD